VSATSYYLVEEFRKRFDCVWIEDQRGYEDSLADLNLLISMEPGWASPVLELAGTPALREKLSNIPSFILYSDPHAAHWRQDYFLKNRLDYILAFYHAPTLRHFQEIPPERIIHFPWAIPDHWVGDDPIRFRGQLKICCSGGAKSEAYAVRNWCRGFDFVESCTNSGVENKVMTDAEYVEWLAQKDASIAAGSDSLKYRLTVPKYFEIAAAGSLLFAQYTDDLERLGFRDMENCIVFDRSSFEKLAKEYLAHPEDYLKIRQAGRELIRSRHTLSNRIQFLEEHISMLVRQKATRKPVVTTQPDTEPGLLDQPVTADSIPASPCNAGQTSSQTGHRSSQAPAPESFLTDKEYWDRSRSVPFTPWEVTKTQFSEILDRHLPVNPDFTCVEIGAYPGTNLCYLAKRFQYYPVAIDFSDYCEHTEQLLSFNKIRDFKVIRQDIFEPIDMKFDVVTSFGFIEHFEDYEAVIDRHFQLLNPGGYVVISCPYLNNFQGMLRKLVYKEDKLHEVLSSHNLRAMDINELGRVIGKYDVDICFSDFILRNHIWFNSKNDFVKPEMRWLVQYLNTINKLGGDNLPSSPLYSPMIMVIAKEKARHRVAANGHVNNDAADHAQLGAPRIVAAPQNSDSDTTAPEQSLSPQTIAFASDTGPLASDLDRNQHRSLQELHRIQWKRTKLLLEHAYENVPFYRRRFDEIGLVPDDIRSMDDFRKIPVLKKTDIQQNLEQIKASNYPAGQIIRDATGGSTGYPLTFFRNAQAELWTSEIAKRFRRWIGYGTADKLALIWGAVQDLPSSHPANQRWLNSFNCSPEQIEAFVRELVEWKPDAIRGYASSLHLVASYIRQKNLRAPRPKAVETGAEKLWDHQRSLIEEVFQCPAFEMYGGREVPSVGCECELHKGLHVFSDVRLVEVIKAGLPVAPGEDGSLVITDLVNYGMPFIRYEIGDVGVASDQMCSCGRGFPLLKEVKGRLINTFPTPDGRYVYGGFFNHLFFNVPGVRAFQVRQKSLHSVDVAVEPDTAFDSSLIEKIVAQMRTHLGPEVHVQWKLVDEIPPAPSGKRHFTISDVPIDLTGTSKDKKTASHSRIAGQANTPRPGTKPGILFIVDSPNWAHDFKTDNLMRVLADTYDMLKSYKCDVTAEQIDAADLVVVYYWKEFNDTNMKKLLDVFRRNKHKLLLGICSHCEMEGRTGRRGLELLKDFAAAIFVNSALLHKEFASCFDVPVFCTPNGVNTEFFTPGDDKKKSETLRVGWAGSLTNNKDVRGYHDFIVPAVESIEGVELLTAAREDKWRNQDEMREFYRSLDVYICASRAEGTPNTCLEAAACGVPLLTTRVGNMPQLIKPGVNGCFIERDIEDIVEKLIVLRDNRQLRETLGASMLESIKSWDWCRQAENYRAMFDSLLCKDNDQHTAGIAVLNELDRPDPLKPNVAADLDQIPQVKVIDRRVEEAVVEVSGLRMFLKPDKYLDKTLLDERLWEQAEVTLLSRLTRPGMTVLDVGANFGYYTLLFSRWVGDAGRVIAFEPTSTYGKRLARHVQENNLQNVRLETKGLSDRAAACPISIGECSGTLHWIESQPPRATETVQLVTLDEWWQQYVTEGNPDKLDLVKVDIDGHEPKFLLGAREVLLRHRPLILMEFFEPQYASAGHSCKEVMDLLEKELGYVLCSVDDGRPFGSNEDLLNRIEDGKLSCDVLCVPSKTFTGEHENVTCPSKIKHPEPSQNRPVDYFIRAAEELDKGNFEPAAECMLKYRTTVDYSRFLRTTFKSRQGENIDISVIQDAACSYEVIVVDNGTSDIEGLRHYADQYVKCPINLVLSEGRNVGACCAKGRIVALLDDDALVPTDYISSIKKAFDTFDIFGLRGRAQPKSNPEANKDAAGYDHGDRPFATFCDLEGNSAFLRDIYLSMNGMDPLLFGHEGSDLTYRITEKYDALNKIIYWPDTVIYHDSIQGADLDEKARRYRLMTEYLNLKHGSNIFKLRKAVESQPLPQKKSQPLTIDEQVAKAKTLLDRGHVVAALREYESLLGISADNVDAHVGRALCLVRLGRLLEAEVEAANALRSDPENPDLQQLAEQMRRLKPDLKGDRDVEWNLVKSQIREITDAQSRGAALLDFGCGQTAELTRFAAGLGHQVTAIDMMPLKVSLEPAASARFIQGDFLQHEWAPKSFDLIINCSSIEHAGLTGRYGVVKKGPDDDLQIMTRMRSLIKADGRMLLTVPVGLDTVVGLLHRVYGQTRLSKLLEGWQVESSRFWIKDENNQWREVDSESALQREPMLAYGIGSFILRPAAAVGEPAVRPLEGPAIASQSSKDTALAVHCQPVPEAGSGEIHSAADYPKASFGIIVLNGEPFTKYCLRALYPFAHEIIVVEGASQKAKAISTPDGHSRDGTLRSLQQFKETEDTENKLKIITRDGFWSEKDEQSQAYAQVATGDYLWQVDIDEFYMPRDMDYILKLLKRDADVSAMSFEQISFWGDLCYKCDSTYLLKGGDVFHRLFRFGNGYRYVTHRPPTVVDPQGVDLRKKKYMSADMMAAEGIYLYHYSLLFPKQVLDKVTYYKHLPGEQCPGMLKWAMNNYHHISNPYRIYNVHTFPGWLERYNSKHPPQVRAMVDDIQSGNLNVGMRDNADVESFIDDPKYHAGIQLIKTEYQRRPDKTLKITDRIFQDASFMEFVNHKTLKVAQFNSGESKGGACRVSMDLSQWLIDNGCRVSKYVGNKDVGNPWVARILDDELDSRLKDVCQKAGLLDYHIQSTFNLLTDTGLSSHDLFHFHNLHGGYFNPFALALLARLKPSVWSLHDMQPLTGHCAHSFECDKWRTGCGQCPNLPIYPAILKDSTAELWRDKKNIYEAINIDLVTPSHWLKSKVEKSILGDKRVRVIPNGIDLNVFRPTEKKLARQLLKIPQDRLVLAFAASGGLTNPWKGGKYLYEAVKHLSTRYPDLLLLNIGGTVNIKDCRVVTVPFITDKKDLAVVYSACDIFAYPAVAETFGLVVLEALTCGLPVVTFDTGGIPEIVEDGKNGIVAEYKNQSEFIKALELLIDNTKLRDQFSRYAAGNIRSMHSVEAMSSAYLNLYLELIYENKLPNRRARTTSVPISADRVRPQYAEFAARLLDVGNTLGAEAFKAEAEKTETSETVSPCQARRPAGTQAETLQDNNQDSALPPVSRGDGSYLVSAIVSTYNSERFIQGCLQDLENQTIADRLEIIVVNSGSQQNEEAIVREFQSRYSNIKYIKTDQRENIYSAWNRAVKASSCRYITTANTDDRHAKDALEKMAAALDANPNKVLVYADQVDVNETQGQRIEVGKRVNGPFSRERLFKGECPPGSQPMWRADIHNRVGYFDEAFAVSGDYEFWFRLTQKYDFLYLNEFLGERLVDPEAVSRTNSGLLSWENMVIDKCYRYALHQRMDITDTGLSNHPDFHDWPEVNIWRQRVRAKLNGSQVSLTDNVKNVWDCRTNPAPKLSVVLVTYARRPELFEALDSLNGQTEKGFEVIVVANDGDLSGLKEKAKGFEFGLCGIELQHNYGPSPARNKGSEFAKAPYIAFMDDDAVADENLVRNIVAHFQGTRASGLRGKVLPKTKDGPRQAPANYDLGDNVIPTACEVSSLSAYRTDVFAEAGRFDERLLGPEGAELSYRICKNRPEKTKSVLYFPDVVVYHDHRVAGPAQTEKTLRQQWMDLLAWRKDPDIRGYRELVRSLYPAGCDPAVEKNYAWIVNVAMCLDKNFPEDAIKWARKANALRPDGAKACYLLGGLCVRLGEYDQAKVVLERVLQSLQQALADGGRQLIGTEFESRNEIAECYLRTCTQLAQCYLHNNDHDKARQIYGC
jgi:FkbM family methyltransferase